MFFSGHFAKEVNTIPEEVPVPAETESGSSSSSDSSDVEKDGNEDDDEFDDKDVEKLNSLVTSVSLILLFIKYSLLKYNIEVNDCYILGRILSFRFYLSYLLSWGHGFLNFFFFPGTLHVCIHLMSRAIFMLVYSFVFASFDPA